MQFTRPSPRVRQQQNDVKKIENKPDETFADFDFVRNEVKEQAQCVPDYDKIMCNKTI